MEDHVLPDRKEREELWWFSPSVHQIIATDKAIKRCNLPPLLIQRIFTTMAEARYPTRPKRAKTSWLEPVCVDGVTYQLSCMLDKEEKMIVVKNIRTPVKPRRKKIHK